MKNQKLERMLEDYKEEEKFQTLKEGVKRLLHFYYYSRQEDNLSNALIIDDNITDNELKSFLEGLKKFEVKEIVFASTWSSAIETLMKLLDAGYQEDGTIIYKKDRWFGKDEIRKGIKLVLR